MNWSSLAEYLRKMFSSTYRSDIEEFIVSKNPQTAADVEHWLQQYTHHTNNWFPHA